LQITKLKKTELIIISIILNLLIGTQEPLIINSWAQDNNEVIIWNWSHWEDENFDPNQMSEDQEQSDPIEIWTLTITFSNIIIIFQDTNNWRKYPGEDKDFNNWTRTWLLTMQYTTEDGINMEASYGVKGFYIGTEFLSSTSADLGRTEAPMNVGFHGIFEERNNNDISLKENSDGSSLIEFSVFYKNVVLYKTENEGDTLLNYSINGIFDMEYKFHIYHYINKTKIKIDSILYLENINFGIQSGNESKNEIYQISMHNDYHLVNRDTGEEIYPDNNKDKESSEFFSGGLPISEFDLGDHYEIKFKNNTIESRNLISRIDYSFNEHNNINQYEYYYWTFFNATDGNTSEIIYDPTIDLFNNEISFDWNFILISIIMFCAIIILMPTIVYRKKRKIKSKINYQKEIKEDENDK